MLAGVDAGHVATKAVVMRGREILGVAAVPTGFDVAAAAEAALKHALEAARVPPGEVAGIAATGIFRDLVAAPPSEVTKTVPEVVADVKGALFLNANSRSVIDLGGNITKAIRYDANGDLLDVIQNDKCADGLGIFYTTMAKTLGVGVQELSDLALGSTRKVSVAIHCAASAESEAIDLLCQGADISDVADAVSRFIVERVAAMCGCISLAEEIVAAGGLAGSRAIMTYLPRLLKQDVRVLDFPEYLGAIGAVMHEEDGE
jgi:predicted CoA-substrate-specific enzyme activase